MVLNWKYRAVPILAVVSLVCCRLPRPTLAAEGTTRVDGGAIHIAVESRTGPAALFRDDPATWNDISMTPIQLNRTPPLYEGDPLDDGFRPNVRMSLVRLPEAFLVRLVWTDATGTPPEPPARMPDAGEASIYKEHSSDVDRFADAACVMVPKSMTDPETYPSLMMGDPEHSVDLYFWHQVRGAQILEASGRSTTKLSGASFPAAARRTETDWEVVFELPPIPPGTPLSFAVWDGARDQRDGLKYYSLWHVAD